MPVLQAIYSTFQGVLFFYFALSTFYNFVLSFAALFKCKLKFSDNELINTFCILIPAYKEDEVILETALQALNQDYSRTKFEVYVIADSLQPETIAKLQKSKVRIIEVSFKNSTKVKALNAAFESISGHFDACVLLDADNLMAADFLTKANKLINAGYISIQGQRLPKNINTTMAFLDGLSEAINTNIFRKGTSNVGLSSSISGSGYVAYFNVLREILFEMDSVSGFDKELEIKFLQRGVKTIYSSDLRIYDEKVSNQQDFKNQRKRWIYSQYYYLAKYFKVGLKALFKFDTPLFNSALLRNAQLPRFLNLAALFICTMVFTLLNILLSYEYYFWWVVLVINVGSIALAIPKKYFSIQLIKAIFHLPKTLFTMFGLLFNLRGTNKGFIHTPHGKK